MMVLNPGDDEIGVDGTDDCFKKWFVVWVLLLFKVDGRFIFQFNDLITLFRE